MKTSLPTRSIMPTSSCHRRSIRLNGYDYAQEGAYYVTVNAWRRQCIFGDVVNAVIELNEFGNIADEEWRRTPEIRTNVNLDEYVIMPDHMHGIIVINENRGGGGSQDGGVLSGGGGLFGRGVLQSAPTQFRSPSQTLGGIIRGFKSATTKRINELRCAGVTPYAHTRNAVWQRNYFQRIIRDENELNRIRQYIMENPEKWEHAHDSEDGYILKFKKKKGYLNGEQSEEG